MGTAGAKRYLVFCRAANGCHPEIQASLNPDIFNYGDSDTCTDRKPNPTPVIHSVITLCVLVFVSLSFLKTEIKMLAKLLGFFLVCVCVKIFQCWSVQRKA